MRRNDLVLNLSINELENALAKLQENTDYLLLSDNLFMVSFIQTCLQVKKNDYGLDNKNVFFKFSYTDHNFRKMVKVNYHFESDSCYDFLRNTNFLNENQVDMINEKINVILKKTNISDRAELEEKTNDIMLNEALGIILGAVNKEDFDSIKNDFLSKYDAWIERKKSINDKGEELVKALYKKILSIKLKNIEVI